MPTTFTADESRILVRFTYRWSEEPDWTNNDTEALVQVAEEYLHVHDAAPGEYPGTFLVNDEECFATAQVHVHLSHLGDAARDFSWMAHEFGLPSTKLTIPATFIRLAEDWG